MAVSTLLSTLTIHERMNSVPLNGIPTSSMATDGAGTVYNYASCDHSHSHSDMTSSLTLNCHSSSVSTSQ